MTETPAQSDDAPWDHEAYRAVYSEVFEAHMRAFLESKRLEPDPNSSSPPKFTGALAEPIEFPKARLQPGLFGAQYASQYGGQLCGERDTLYRVLALQEVKMLALATAYGLSPQTPAMWKVLAMNLARDFVPGVKVAFQRPKRRGRPKGVGNRGAPALDKLSLFFEVQRRLFTTNHPIAAICGHLAKKGQAFDQWSQGTLETAYHEIKSRTPDTFAQFGPAIWGEAADDEAEPG